MRLILVSLLFLFSGSPQSFSQNSKAESLKQSKQALLSEIETGLKKIMENYRNKPNTEESWKQIKNDANFLLYSYYRNQKLLGNKPQEAYYTQIGMQTMTTADISANRKVLIAGISLYKPAEFLVITVDSRPTNTFKKNE